MFLQTSHGRRYNAVHWRLENELERNRYWFVARVDINMRELVMSYLEDDYCTAYHIADLEIEIHHPNLHRARNPHNP